MNGLTVNLHLMMATFYRPTRQRWRILVEDCTFPTDTYALRTQLRHHGFDPDTGLIVVRPRPGEDAVREEDIEARLDREGESIAVVMLGGVNYFTGQVFDMRRVAAAARRRGCVVGYDLAHAAGNVELSLHAWEVDFAVWCTYKYVNGGPGCVAGCFVHERHARDTGLARLGGWWGNDPARRFLMHLEPQFKPVASADGWQVSNPPLLSLAALKASLEIFDEIGMAALREKSVRLTGYLLHRLDGVGGQFEVITPREPERRGCQVSLRIRERAREVFQRLLDAGVVGDFREPDVIRLAPAPLYNTFHEVWRLGQIMKSVFA
jgi:kynureninase